MSFTAFSQTLKPTVLTVNLDTNFCFTIPQSKFIAENLIKAQFADSLEIKFEQEIADYQFKSFQDLQIQERLNKMILNQDTIIQNNEESIIILTNQIKFKDKQLKRAKWHKILLSITTVALSTAIILK